VDTAARNAARVIATAAHSAASVLSAAAKEASAAAAAPHESWGEYKMLVMAELKRLNSSLDAGLSNIGTSVESHVKADSEAFAAQLATHTKLAFTVATLIERTNRQLWVVYGTAIGSVCAVIVAILMSNHK
jgi:hypothetical protein